MGKERERGGGWCDAMNSKEAMNASCKLLCFVSNINCNTYRKARNLMLGRFIVLAASATQAYLCMHVRTRDVTAAGTQSDKCVVVSQLQSKASNGWLTFELF